MPRAKGRKLEKEKCIFDPSLKELTEAAHAAGFEISETDEKVRFPKRPYVYAMHTYQEAGREYNRVLRLKDEGGKGIFDRVVIDRIPGARLHNGGRISFGPDGLLYVATGEIFEAKFAQNQQLLLREFHGRSGAG